ncbi:MAG: hypothetical protein H0U21_01815 [Acidimicrobiia bacterium]|nr:hypothetical protein [Acidimicrobiia bacterium]
MGPTVVVEGSVVGGADIGAPDAVGPPDSSPVQAPTMTVAPRARNVRREIGGGMWLASLVDRSAVAVPPYTPATMVRQ